LGWMGKSIIAAGARIINAGDRIRGYRSAAGGQVCDKGSAAGFFPKVFVELLLRYLDSGMEEQRIEIEAHIRPFTLQILEELITLALHRYNTFTLVFEFVDLSPEGGITSDALPCL
jgi:hypothetical protein